METREEEVLGRGHKDSAQKAEAALQTVWPGQQERAATSVPVEAGPQAAAMAPLGCKWIDFNGLNRRRFRQSAKSKDKDMKHETKSKQTTEWVPGAAK